MQSPLLFYSNPLSNLLEPDLEHEFPLPKDSAMLMNISDYTLIRATQSVLNKTTWDFLHLPCSHCPLASNSALRPSRKMRSDNGHVVAMSILPSLPHLCEFRQQFFLLQSQDSGFKLTDSLSFPATEAAVSCAGAFKYPQCHPVT